MGPLSMTGLSKSFSLKCFPWGVGQEERHALNCRSSLSPWKHHRRRRRHHPSVDDLILFVAPHLDVGHVVDGENQVLAVETDGWTRAEGGWFLFVTFEPWQPDFSSIIIFFLKKERTWSVSASCSSQWFFIFFSKNKKNNGALAWD